jgi:hypothetical protein
VKNRSLAVSIVVLVVVWHGDQGHGLLQAVASGSERDAYLGFDRNEYPGDQNLAVLRRTFSYTGYWLNVPPGAKSNTWTGKRKAVQEAGFGFLVLFNGRLDAQLKKGRDAGELGREDAAAAVDAAERDGFPPGTVIFLDQEEGGRMLPEQKAYIYAWVDGVNASGFRAGIYASGIAASEAHGVRVITAEDIQQNAEGRNILYWVTNDACPPSPGCAFPKRAPVPSESGIGFAQVWQFAQTPKRRDVAGGCPANYDRDGSCYAPEAPRIFVDVNSAWSGDPSRGRVEDELTVRKGAAGDRGKGFR